MAVFYSVIFFVPSALMLMYTGGKFQMSREELLETETAKRQLARNEERIAEEKAKMEAVWFKQQAEPVDMRWEWAIKRDQKREEERLRKLAEQQK